MTNQQPHNFWNSLQYENDKSVLADDFYLSNFGVEKIIRFNSGDKRDMEFQRADIDVQLHGWGRFSNVSEKFRDVDYNDLYVELFSMFPDVQGWMDNSEASHLAYFFPKRMIWLDKKQLISAFQSELTPLIKREWISELIQAYPQKNGSQSYQITLNGNNYTTRIIKAYNKTRTKQWDTIGASFPFELITEIGVKLKEYKL